MIDRGGSDTAQDRTSLRIPGSHGIIRFLGRLRPLDPRKKSGVRVREIGMIPRLDSLTPTRDHDRKHLV